MMERIFLLEDDTTLSRGISMALCGTERTVVLADSIAQAQQKLTGTQFDLLILDINLPDGSGLELLRTLRTQGDTTPTILLTANDLELDEVTGLEAGADDYITKPFDLREVIARVKSILRRFEKAESERAKKDPAESTNSGDLLCRGPLVISRQGWTVTKNGQRMDLTPKEFELLVFLLEHPGQVFTRATLLEQIWGYDFEGDTRTVDIHIQRLRKKLGNDVGLSTVFGVGYKYEPQKQAE